MRAVQGQMLSVPPARAALKGGPAGAAEVPAAAPADPVSPLGRDAASFSTPAQRVLPQAAGSTVKAQGLPAWVPLAGFAGIWGIWGFPAALLGAIGFWVANKMIDSVAAPKAA